MGLQNIKRKLFSKRISSKVTAVPATQAQTPRILETLVAHKSRIHLQPPEVSVSRSSLSEASNPDSQSDRPDLGRADILLHVLPIIKELIGRCEDHSKHQAVKNGASYRRSPKFAYLGHASTAISLLEKYLASLQESGQASEFDDTITQLAQCLESMLGNPDNVISHDLLRELCRQSQTPSNNSDKLLKLAQQNLNSLGNEDWKTFSQSLASLTDQLQCVGQDVKEEKPERDRATILRRPLSGVGELIGHTFSVMACNCSIHSFREMSLRLCTYKGSNTPVHPEVVTVLAKEMRGSPRQWAEIRVHGSHEIQSDRRARKIKVGSNFSSDDERSPTHLPSFPLRRSACICDCYNSEFSPEFWGLNIRLNSSKISEWWPDNRVLSSAASQHQFNLQQLISTDGSKMSGLAKMTLPVFLAYSIFYLYGGSWVKRGWKRENIVFFADGNYIPMRPFLNLPAQLSPSDQDLSRDESMSFHRYPEFLELGIMMLEIYFGQRLENMRPRAQDILSMDGYYAAASEVYGRKKLDIISKGWRNAIEICLKPDFNMDLDREDLDDHDVRIKIFDAVVQPLERELEQAFPEYISIDTLDDRAPTEIQLPLPTTASTLVPLSGGTAGSDNQRSWRSGLMKHILESPGTVPQNFELFSNESKTTESPPDMATATDDWVERFMRLVAQLHVDNGDHPAQSNKTPSCRLKLAILDTGIDINHPEFFGDERVKACKAWTSTSADEDSSGHGTHIASTILSLTRNVDVYVAKVTENNFLEHPDNVADAINFACQEWKVDIISCSFGFHRGIQSIQEAIDKAVSPEYNVIILAAASNDASNTPRAYPANHDWVICVHSADGLGNRSKFNPTPVEGTDNFCVVGEDIEAAWPSGQTQYQGVRRMSGTSFATPVGVAVAVFMLEYVEKKVPQHVEWLIPLRSYRGVRAIFNALSQRRDGPYHLVNPVYDFSRGESAIRQVLSKIEIELNR